MEKMNIRKVLAVILLSSIMLMLVSPTVMAGVGEQTTNQDDGIAPLMTYIVECKNSLTISGSTATVDCWVNGHVNTATKAKVIAELQVKSGEDNWIPVAIWTDTQNDFEAAVYETKTVTKGNTYRVKATFTVWEGTASETCTSYTEEVN